MRVDGTPAQGRVTFTPLRPTTSPTLKLIIVDAPYNVTLNEAGAFTAIVPAGDGQNLSSILYMRVDWYVDDRIKSYTVLVPESAATVGVDLVDLTPVEIVAEMENYILASSIDAPNGVAPLDGMRKVPLANLPNTIGQPGPAGPPGPPGEQGPPGENIYTPASSYEHVHPLAETVWDVQHNLGRYPVAWSLYDSLGNLCDNYVVQHMSIYRLRVSMDQPTAGTIRMM